MGQNSTQDNSEIDRWFIQLKSQIIGPIPGAKVLELLVKDDISVTHRASRDRREWTAICNIAFFEELIQSRIRAYSGESVSVGQMRPGGDDEDQFEISQVFGLHGATDGISAQLDEARQLEELTANIQKLNLLRKEIVLKRKTVTHEKEANDEDEIHPDDQNVFIPVIKKKSFKFQDLLKGDLKSNRRMIGLAIVIAIGLGLTQGYYFYQNFQTNSNDRAKLQIALDAQAAGDYGKVIATFKTINQKSLGEKDFASAKQLIDLADSHIRGKDHKTGDRLLAMALEQSPSPIDRARAHALRAQIASLDGNFNQATVELEESLKFSEIFSTLHNLAVLKIKAKKFAEAETLLLKALEGAAKTPGLDTTPTLLALFETAIALDQKTTTVPNADSTTDTNTQTSDLATENAINHPRLMKVLELLKAANTSAKSMPNELRLANAVTRFHLRDSPGFQLYALDLIDSINDTSSDSENPQLDVSLAKWSNLYRYCTEIYSLPKSGDFVAAFYASCLRRSHGAQAALPFAKYAHASRPTDAIYIGLNASLMIELKMNDEAKQLLTEGNPSLSGSRLADRAIKTLNLRLPAAETPPAPSSPDVNPTN